MKTTMHATPYLLPKPVGQLLSHLPAYPGSLMLVTGLNLALTRQLRLCVTDTQWTFDFEWLNGRFSACQNKAAADLTISASAHDFLLLARRQEDPDTLFFSRRLAMEGDTELGLLVKNTLDAIELPVFNLEQFKPAQVLARLRQRFGAGRSPR
jgi:predicted lipid carrier protein YhbT